MSKRIVVDAGHGGFDNGASYDGRLEKNDNLKLALQVGKDLADMGYEVFYTRDSDVYQSPLAKATIGNEAGADFFVSIHRNASQTPNEYTGIQTLIFNDSGIKSQMAANVNSELEKLGFKNLGISIRPNLTVLKRSQMPAILVEAGFLNNDTDNALFDSKFNEIAQAIAKGINETIQQESEVISTTPTYSVQIGLFKNYGNAQALLANAQKDGYSGVITASGPYFAVQLGNYTSLDEAAKTATKLRTLGYDTLVVSQ